jgi:hypothetical protein
MRRLAVAVALSLTACHDSGADTLAAARAKYEALLAAGASPSARSFEPLLEELRSIPADSRASAEARALIANIEAARGARAPLPLAAHGCEGLTPGLDPTKQREVLEECRRRAQRDDHGEAR